MTNNLSKNDIELLVAARHYAPRSVLGFHEIDNEHGLKEWVIRTFEPEANTVALFWRDQTPEQAQSLKKIHPRGLFEIYLQPRPQLLPYQFHITYKDGNQETHYDPYYFSPQLSEFDLYLFGKGSHQHIYEKLGAHLLEQDGIAGVRFAVWAPNASRVSVVGDFNYWDGRKHTMQVRESSGVWELFVPHIHAGTCYKYEILSQSGDMQMKADPYGFAMQKRPQTASIVTNLAYAWHDQQWMQQRDQSNILQQAINIYEVHPGSWKRHLDQSFYSYLELADELIAYVLDMGYTHIEFMGLAEHPLDSSWGYQVTGYYAANSRHGSPQELMYLIDRCHQAGIGVIMDWVPAHFPNDAHGLAWFDGSALYEHADPRLGEHRDWGTKIFNYGRNEVRNFLIANALFWLEKYHIDGIRVDAVASMLYLDYSRKEGEWLPNEYGGRENLAAISFLQELNKTLFHYYPGILSIAEESTAYTGVSRPVYMGGLGFNLKWNMGWMNDTLRYIAKDPVHRKYDNHLLTFSMVYAYSEQYVLPISHDEVVHGKRSLLSKMPGDDWQKRANYRLYLSFMLAHPGKKLLFMGSEFGQWEEWSESHGLNWSHLEYEFHQQLQHFCRSLNRFYRQMPLLFQNDFNPAGFAWIDLHDHENCVYSLLRRDPTGQAAPLIFVFNFTPVPRNQYAIGVDAAGSYKKCFDSDWYDFGGAGYNQQTEVVSAAIAWHNRPQRLLLDIPPLGALIYRLK